MLRGAKPRSHSQRTAAEGERRSRGRQCAQRAEGRGRTRETRCAGPAASSHRCFMQEKSTQTCFCGCPNHRPPKSFKSSDVCPNLCGIMARLCGTGPRGQFRHRIAHASLSCGSPAGVARVADLFSTTHRLTVDLRQRVVRQRVDWLRASVHCVRGGERDSSQLSVCGLQQCNFPQPRRQRSSGASDWRGRS